jgi:hypothetical protein
LKFYPTNFLDEKAIEEVENFGKINKISALYKSSYIESM